MNSRTSHFHIKCGITAAKREITAQPRQSFIDKRPGEEQSSIVGYSATATDNCPHRFA
jgi:hypothetical protein